MSAWAKNNEPRTDMKTDINIRKTALVVLCALALSPTVLFAKSATKTAAEHGILKSVDSQNQQLVVTDQKTKMDRTFHWNDQTKFTEQGKATSAPALRVGEHLVINYASDKETATMISASAKPARSAKHAHASASIHPRG
jgi:hypothetical protein